MSARQNVLRLHVSLAIVTVAALTGVRASAQSALPEPTFVVSFDGTTAPQVEAGRRDHPANTVKGVRFVAGRKGQAVLLGDGPILVYQTHGNVPHEATLCFWIKPDWQPWDHWRDVLTLRPPGRAGMMFANYPKSSAHMRFAWAARYGVEHEPTEKALEVKE